MKVGYHKEDITPLTPQFVCGHAMREGRSIGVHDHLEICVLWLEIEDNKICFINADLIMMSFAFCDEVRSCLAKEYDISNDQIILTVTHTHSGPNFNDHDAKMMPGDKEYIEYVKQKLYQSVMIAQSNTKAFNNTVVTQGLITGYYGNRNDIKKEGDKWAYLVRFKNDDKTVAALANLSCHSTVVDPTSLLFSADLLGNIRHSLEDHLNIPILITNGSAGDMSNRQYRKGNDWGQLQSISVGIAQQMTSFTDDINVNLSPIVINPFCYRVKYQQDVSLITKKLNQLENNLKNSTKFDEKKWLYSEIAGYKRRIEDPIVDLRLDGEVIRMGDIEFVIIPGELASNFGLQLKRSSNAKVCIVIGYANGLSTYIVEASEFNGGHDGISTSLKRGQAEEYVGKIIQNMV